MGEEDPQRPSRHLCYHFMPRMSGDLQGYLTKVGHGALSNLLMQHKEDPTMLQLVVDNTKHILRSILKGMAYLHGSNIVHNDVKRERKQGQIQTGLCNKHVNGGRVFCLYSRPLYVSLDHFCPPARTTPTHTYTTILYVFVLVHTHSVTLLFVYPMSV